MKLEAFARTLLFGTTLEEKLLGCQPEFEPSNAAPIEIPAFPGRPLRLSRPGKAGFPSIDRLQEPLVRGEVLHFFANHELLALELMALVLLRFPEAPAAFQKGLVRTIQEEQTHLGLYLGRMRDFGVEFGDLPVSDYFWNSLSHSRSPLEFVTQMSLTLEQANLDFAFSFQTAFARIGDLETSRILEQVLLDEIGHVRHGLTWFNRWRGTGAPESEWEAYQRLLPAPMTPRRAKGFEFREEPRRSAGLSEDYIRNLRLHTGSKGRPPVVFFYNPHCDAEIARGKSGHSPTRGALRLREDLETVPLFFASEQDLCLVTRAPDPDWLESIQAAGIPTPEFAALSAPIRAPKIGGLQPWGWSPETWETLRLLQSRLVAMAGGNAPWCSSVLEHPGFQETGIGPLFSKAWSVEFLRSWLVRQGEASGFHRELETVGTFHAEWTHAFRHTKDLLVSGQKVMIKAPYGTSGMQVRAVRSAQELEGASAAPLLGWMRNTFAQQGALIVEPWLDKVCDLSIQIEVGPERVRLLDTRRFLTGNHREYLGTYLGKKRPGFEPEVLRFFHGVQAEWQTLIRDLGHALRAAGYQGPAGIDALIWRDPEGALRLKPVIEVNPRWTMGRVALELEHHLAPATSAIWCFIRLRDLASRGFSSAGEFAERMLAQHPLTRVRSGAGQNITSGVVFTTDPRRAQEVLTVLATLPNAEIQSFLDDGSAKPLSGRIPPGTCDP